jgi:hypothetical protein
MREQDLRFLGILGPETYRTVPMLSMRFINVRSPAPTSPVVSVAFLVWVLDRFPLTPIADPLHVLH